MLPCIFYIVILILLLYYPHLLSFECLFDDIWELRPGNNRVLYFYFKNDTFVLLHQFRKKTQKTPKREIERAKAERDDYLARKEAE